MTDRAEKVLRALVTEDDSAARALLERVLGQRGYAVTACPTSTDAMACFEDGEFDLVLLDWMLPDFSGVELCKLIRRHTKGQNCHIVMITVRGGRENLQTILDAGADDYLQKPVDLGDLEIRLTIAEKQIAHRQERNSIERALRESEERYALAARGANDALWDWEVAEDRLYLSPRWWTLAGRPAPGNKTKIGLNAWLESIHPEDVTRVKSALQRHLDGQTEQLEVEYRVIYNGIERWVLTRGLAVREPGGNARRIAGSHTDLTNRGVYDSLTGLPSRTLFMHHLECAVAQEHDRGDRPFALLFIDLDRFKDINDSLGHAAGDRYLRIIAGRLRECLRPGDRIARFGGDEFTILLERLTSVDDALTIAHRIRTALSDPVEVQGSECVCSASIGIVQSSANYTQADEMIRDADTAMYEAKHHGSFYRIFNRRMREAAIDQMRLVSGLRRAVRHGEFINHYQPILSLTSGELLGFETLVRWQHPSRGMMLPDEFIALAEERGLIGSIGEKIFHTAFEQLQDWLESSGTPRRLHLSLNLSPKQLAMPSLAETVGALLREFGIPPELVVFEITEEAIIEDLAAAKSILRKLKSLSIAVCIDDFGTGYSSLKYLHQLPVDMLKIDRSFVRALRTDPQSTEIVRTILELSRRLGIQTVAEGIETGEQLDQLRKLGCEYGQGSLFAMPLSAREAGLLIQAPSVARPDSF